MSSSLRRHFKACGVTLALGGAAHGAVGQDRASFDAADSDGGGALNFSEAQQNPALCNRWQRIDRAEFSAFERTGERGDRTPAP